MIFSSCFNYKYFAVQYGRDCHCGNSYGRYGKRPARYCRLRRCTGPRSVIFGGGWSNMVFKVNRKEVHEPTKLFFSWTPNVSETYPIIFDAGSPNEASTRKTVYIIASYGPSNIQLKLAPRFIYENKINMRLDDVVATDPNDDTHIISMVTGMNGKVKLSLKNCTDAAGIKEIVTSVVLSQALNYEGEMLGSRKQRATLLWRYK